MTHRPIIIVPALGLVTDKEALEQIKALHPKYGDRVYQVNIVSIIDEFDGALNYLIWTKRTMLSAQHDYEESDNKFHELFVKTMAANNMKN